jgi:putative inorganic carbon (HCO3(-)) transporter
MRLVAAGGSAVMAVGLGAALTALAARTSVWLPPAFALAVVFVAIAIRRPFVGVVATVLALPVGLHHVAGPVKLAQAVTILTVGAVALHRLWQGRAPLPLPGPLRWALALVAVGLLSAATALETSPAFRQVLDVAVGAAFAMAVVAVVDSRTAWLSMQRALLVAGVAVTGPALLSARHLQAHFGGSVVTGRPVGIFSQPNELGTFSMLLLLVAVGVLLANPRRLDRVLAVVSIVTATGALLLSLSRGAWIGATAGIVLLVVAVPRARRAVGLTAAVVILGAAMLGAFAPSAPQVHIVTSRLHSLGHAQQNPYDDRPRIWREALREISDRPLLGEGPDNFPIASTRSVSAASTVQADHAHDVVLTVAAESGLLGAAVLVGLTVAIAGTVVGGLRRARRQRDVRATGLLGGLAAACAGMMGQGLVDFTLRDIVVAEACWLVVGLALAGTALVRTPSPQAPPAARA